MRALILGALLTFSADMVIAAPSELRPITVHFTGTVPQDSYIGDWAGQKFRLTMFTHMEKGARDSIWNPATDYVRLSVNGTHVPSYSGGVHLHVVYDTSVWISFGAVDNREKPVSSSATWFLPQGSAIWFRRDGQPYGAVKSGVYELGQAMSPFGMDRVQDATFRIQAVPEPATWAMMIVGFGLIGMQMRRQRGFSALSG